MLLNDYEHFLSREFLEPNLNIAGKQPTPHVALVAEYVQFAVMPELTDYSPLKLSRTGGSGTLSTGINKNGRVRTYTTAADYFQDYGRFDPTDGYWWLLAGTFSSMADWAGFFSRTVNNGTNRSFEWRRDGSQDKLRADHPSGAAPLGTILDLLDGEYHVYVGYWGGVDDPWVRFIQDGVEIRTQFMSPAPAYTSGQGQLKIGASADTDGMSAAINIAAYGSKISLDLAKSLSKNPYQIFESVGVLELLAGDISIPSNGMLSAKHVRRRMHRR